MKIDEPRRDAWKVAEQTPFRQEQGRVDPEDDGDQATRPEPCEETPGRFGRWHRKDRGCGDEVREARDWKPREEEPVADGVARHLLSEQRGGGEWHYQGGRSRWPDETDDCDIDRGTSQVRRGVASTTAPNDARTRPRFSSADASTTAGVYITRRKSYRCSLISKRCRRG